jgi:aldose 1-epimerase
MYKWIIIIAVFVQACGSADVKQEETSNLMKENFDTIVAGKNVSLYLLENKNGIKVYVTNYGARLVSIQTPDKKGEFADIILGYNTIDEYLKDNIYSGCIVGRFANRIKDGKFSIDTAEYQLFLNDGDNTLHGGKEAFNKKVWDAKQTGNSIELTYLSPDGEEGYPGNLTVSKTLTLTDDNELKIEYKATTDAPTIINLSNHTYWNLKGEGDSTILDHYFQINADSYTPVDSEWIPTGEIAGVDGTPFDFRKGKQVGQDILSENEQLANGKGYDHNWVLNKEKADSLTFAAKLWDGTSGRVLEIYTTEPGLQFYSGNFLDGSVKGKSGEAYQFRSAMIFETQHFPDSPNHDNFPSTVLNPGEEYYHLAVIKFGTLE